MIIKYARSMNESLNSNVENLYKLEDGHAEALEFYIKEDSAVTNVPLNRLHIRKISWSVPSSAEDRLLSPVVRMNSM